MLLLTLVCQPGCGLHVSAPGNWTHVTGCVCVYTRSTLEGDLEVDWEIEENSKGAFRGDFK